MGPIEDRNMALLGKLLDLHAENQKVMAGNVANVNTPHYRRKEFSFKDQLREAIESGKNDFSEVQGITDKPNTTLVRNNGNNVDIDQEMVAINENATLYQIYTQLYSKKSAGIKSAITGNVR